MLVTVSKEHRVLSELMTRVCGYPSVPDPLFPALLYPTARNLTMTLLDAPVFDEARERRRLAVFYSTAGLLFVLFMGFWLAAGRPVDYPWNWNNHLRGRMAVNSFLTAVEKNDLPAAYGIWIHDKDWQQHPASARQLYL